MSLKTRLCHVHLRTRVIVVIAAAVLLSSCSVGVFETGFPLEVTVTVDRTVAPVGRNFRFSYEIRGSGLETLSFTFGDERIETISMHGANMAAGWVDHAYDFPGSFDVVVTASEGFGMSQSIELSLEVTPAS